MSTTMGRCKGCGAQIVWVKTKAGKNMPCDPQFLNYKEVAGGKEKIVTPEGEVVSGITDVPNEAADGFGYISHFATCKMAGGFRKRKPKKRMAV